MWDVGEDEVAVGGGGRGMLVRCHVGGWWGGWGWGRRWMDGVG